MSSLEHRLGSIWLALTSLCSPVSDLKGGLMLRITFTPPNLELS